MTDFQKREILELVSILFLIFFSCFLLNFLWEAIHSVYLYKNHDFAASSYIPMLIYVSSVDSLVVLGLYIGVSIIWLNLFWIKVMLKSQVLVFLFIGIVVAAIIEYRSAIYFHRWMYREDMPTVFGIGISPLVQLSITGIIAVWLTKELLYGKGLFRNEHFDL